jgi:hypothetical protein
MLGRLLGGRILAAAGAGIFPVLEAVEWREPAPGGGSQSQVFRLSDGRFAIIKFPENGQGERVLANELLSCKLAERLDLPVNRAHLVVIDERTLKAPRQSGQIPAAFTAGVRCGMIRFEQCQACQPPDILAHCENFALLHDLVAFDQLLCRGDGRQWLMYPAPSGTRKWFAAHDYGFAFGGQPNWAVDTLATMPPPVLPTTNPYDGTAYADGNFLAHFIGLIRGVNEAMIRDTFSSLYAPRWGVTAEAIDALCPVVAARAASLVAEFDARYTVQAGVV